MRSILLSGLLLLAASAVKVLGVDTLFTHPGTYDEGDEPANNPVYEEGDTIIINWVTDLKQITVYVFQRNPSDFDGTTQLGEYVRENVTSKSTFWKVSLGEDSFNRTVPKGEMPVLYFALYNPSDDAVKIIKSQDFNISLSDAAESSSTTTKGTAASTIADGPAKTSSEADDDDGLSAGAGAGIAVGATLGVLALAGIGFFFWRRMRRPEPQYQQPQQYQQYQQYNVPPTDPNKPQQPTELVGHYHPQQQQQQQAHIYEAP
ncbi:hypothetical protein BHE90_008063 [Fusarium euwallaceae]|uniref:Mid2 domain-containing protein n=3 Tax=Fusarium solani species complex TaxID=232080 RepID=A0A3M2SDZ8_9HYPO|nr:hypothetical protein CDV36_004577 [Fusarium kuroshium]RSM04014.1 hypothetical protein CDV31_010204 [Fusarium ambrosium]RTE77454.1 hypothetical protein BHE90_008063 [Fusarium euwallaceae]